MLCGFDVRWFLLLPIVFICFDANAKKKTSGSGGWSQSYYQQGQSQRTYYQTTDGRYYYVGTDGRSYWYQPTTVQNTNRADAQSGCTHGPEGSVCRHRYDVNQTYQVTQGDVTLGAGNINYRGGRENQYSHHGSSGEISSVDRVEQPNAERNVQRTKEFALLAAFKAAMEETRIAFQQKIQAGGITREGAQSAYQILGLFERFHDRLSQAASADDEATRQRLVLEGLDQLIDIVRAVRIHFQNFERGSATYEADLNLMMQAESALMQLRQQSPR